MGLLDHSLNSERLVTVIIGMFCCDACVITYTYYDDRKIARKINNELENLFT